MRMTREEAYKMAIKACESVWNDKTCKQIKSALSEQRTGHWQDLTGLFFCSECDGGFQKAWKYCPFCGAKMESEVPLPAPYEPQESEVSDADSN